MTPPIPTIQLGQDCTITSVGNTVEIKRDGKIVGRIVLNDVKSTTALCDELWSRHGAMA